MPTISPACLICLGGIDVRRRWFQAPRRVIVGHNYSRSAVSQRISEDFPGMNRTAVYQSDRHDSYMKDFIGAVDGDRQEVLLLAI